MKEFGEDYAKQVVKNARSLAEALHKYGFHVLGDEAKGFTQSHLLLVDLEDLVKLLRENCWRRPEFCAPMIFPERVRRSGSERQKSPDLE